MPDQDEIRPQGIKSARLDDDDVEGHSFKQARVDGGDDDVEGHGGMAPRPDGGPDEFGRLRHKAARIDADDDDVEGHFSHLKSPSSRGE
jgi:hypothetical protein